MTRLLIVDDDPFIRESLKLILNQDPSLTVVGACSNGIEAYQFCLDHENVDLVLMDIRMPVCNGVECAKKIKKDRPHIRILILPMALPRPNSKSSKSQIAIFYLKDEYPSRGSASYDEENG